jgi:hypothetical protein
MFAYVVKKHTIADTQNRLSGKFCHLTCQTQSQTVFAIVIYFELFKTIYLLRRVINDEIILVNRLDLFFKKT